MGGRRLMAWLLGTLLRGLAVTWRVRFQGSDPLADGEAGARLGALWHRNILIGAGVWRDRGLCIPISRSRDGDLVSAVILRLGFATPPRGSSNRAGSRVFRELVRRIRDDADVVVISDGPLGPARRSKPGTVALARLSGVPVVPVACSARPALRFASWDGTLLPLPFARVECAYGQPLPVPGDADDAQLAALRDRLDAEMNRLTDALDARLGRAV
jgi:lysophospholipid acyltransferase (LPLAT)-like uncharacterized protein